MCPALDFGVVQEGLEIRDDALVWPGCRNNRPDAAPIASHLCLPFDGIEPAGVQVIVLGEDPYPSVSGATGRAFEDGTLDATGEALKLVLRVLGQSALDLHGEACLSGFCHGREGRAAAIRRCFDRLAGQGGSLLERVLDLFWARSQKRTSTPLEAGDGISSPAAR